MRAPARHTVGEALYWRYAHLAMMERIVQDRAARPGPRHYMIRTRLYSGLRKGTMNVRGFFDDERLKATLPQVCWYCGSTDRLSMDHIIPRSRGGGDSGENLLTVCHPCNSSKGSKDLIVWMRARGGFPCLYLLRRYLKLAIMHCREIGVMDLPLADAASLDLPFNFAAATATFPPVAELQLWVRPVDSTEAETDR